ncbi:MULTISPECIES: NAD(P)-dependent oxidoreductase [Vibrio]|jgi:precorrin-2 dehydrogenase/sirohydrochlorin ferrochelatase|uniref:siroheme synthase n=1 Tax=Vibrio TaxID=662 RepID=UPI0001542DBB|nr:MULTISPECIES: NAD(P)-dependent oxidoreductase [Vibrio]EDL51816.1 uroporphyrin-III C-methyltransferase [Vibrio mediterranei AK1]MCY9852842.1 siroheme synthase [Vibrio mediterranei]MDA0109826.1 siroheme synthase [Vibrio sp. La 4.2.2]NOH27667.1 siroheme synthase [Vibrio mediterranei]NUW72529.1 siroheme synthase [Vibrio mediterranei]
MRYFPLFMDLLDRPVLVVGGGEVACRKVDTLTRAGARVTIVSPQLEPYLDDLVEQGKCLWVKRFYEAELMHQDFVQVWATTDNPELNHQVHKDAKKMGILVNVVDDTPYCDFITPSIINRGRVQIAISSGGASPVLIRGIREKLESILPMNTAQLADFAASKRGDIKQHFATVDERRKFWELFFNEPRVVECKNNHELELAYQQLINSDAEFSNACTWIKFGVDPELLPIKALRIMQEAEVVFFDKSCPFGFVDLVRRDAERIEFQDIAQVSQDIQKRKANKERIVVFVDPQSSSHRLLKEGDEEIGLAQIK